LKKNYVRIVKDSGLKLLVSRNKEANDVFLQANLDKVDFNPVPGSLDLYGNITIHIILESDPTYHHCHIQLKKKAWQNYWEPLLTPSVPSPPVIVKQSSSKKSKGTKDDFRKARSHEYIILDPPIHNTDLIPLRPRSLSNDSRRSANRHNSHPIKKQQRRRSARPTKKEDKEQSSGPTTHNHRPSPKISHTRPVPTTPTIKDLEDIFERGGEKNREINMVDIYDLLRRIYKETLLMKRELRHIKADIAALKEKENY